MRGSQRAPLRSDIHSPPGAAWAQIVPAFPARPPAALSERRRAARPGFGKSPSLILGLRLEHVGGASDVWPGAIRSVEALTSGILWIPTI